MFPVFTDWFSNNIGNRYKIITSERWPTSELEPFANTSVFTSGNFKICPYLLFAFALQGHQQTKRWLFDLRSKGLELCRVFADQWRGELHLKNQATFAPHMVWQDGVSIFGANTDIMEQKGGRGRAGAFKVKPGGRFDSRITFPCAVWQAVLLTVTLTKDERTTGLCSS